MENGTPEEKVRAVETLTKFATLMQLDQTNDAAKQMGQMCSDAVRRGAADVDPAVRAWSTYLFALLPSGDKSLINTLVNDPSWVARVLGIVATDYIGESKDVYSSLAENDPNPLVKKLAAAALAANIKRSNVTTQPATQPANMATTQPGGAPGAAPTTGPVTQTPPAAAGAPALAADVAPRSDAAAPAPGGTSQPTLAPLISPVQAVTQPVPLPATPASPVTPATSAPAVK
jgi:hypothetical protein